MIHDDQIERYGGLHGVRSLDLLASSVFKPQASFDGKDLYPTIFAKAASLLVSLVLNHAFVDGNKRTGVVSTLVFLEVNGYRLKVSADELFDTMIGVVSKKIGQDQIAKWLEKNSTSLK